MTPEQMQETIDAHEVMLASVQEDLDRALVALSFVLKGQEWKVPDDRADVLSKTQMDAIVACALQTLVSAFENVAQHRSTVPAERPFQKATSALAHVAARFRDLKAGCGPPGESPHTTPPTPPRKKQ